MRIAAKRYVGFAPGFQQDDFRRQGAWEWEFAPERVVFMDGIVQTQLLQSQKKRGKDNFALIGQVSAAFEGRIKPTVQGTFITLPCCRTTEMKKRQHSEEDNKDIMMGNTTLKCQWNGQFWKPSGKQMLQKHDNLLRGFPAHLLPYFFFPCSTTVNSVLAFGTKKIKGRGKNVKQNAKA